jgi:hypothetical protein
MGYYGYDRCGMIGLDQKGEAIGENFPMNAFSPKA